MVSPFPRASFPVYLLAGGRSRRMEGDKRELVVGGRTLLDRAVALALPGPLVVVAKERPAGLPDNIPLLRDSSPEFGPIHGLAAALRHAAERGEGGFLLLAVDLPLLRRSTVERIAAVARADSSGPLAVVPLSGGRWQVLAAWYPAGIAGEVERWIGAGEPSIRELVASIPHRLVRPEELGAEEEQFLNVNTPEDAAEAARLLEARGERE
jgi:molybdopterin-guanine dinucleotide biosynthesis protein A